VYENTREGQSGRAEEWDRRERRNALKGLLVTGPEDTSGMSRKDNRDAKGAQKAQVKAEVQEWESRRVC
jgi:hypothetical protein